MYAKINENDYTINEARLIEAWTVSSTGNNMVKKAPAHFKAPNYELNIDKGDGIFHFNKGSYDEKKISITSSAPPLVSTASRMAEHFKGIFEKLSKKDLNVSSRDIRSLKKYGLIYKDYNNMNANDKKVLQIYYLKRFLLLYRWAKNGLTGPFDYQTMWKKKIKGSELKKNWPKIIKGTIKDKKQIVDNKFYYYNADLDEKIHEVSTNPFKWPTPYRSLSITPGRKGDFTKVISLRNKFSDNCTSDTCRNYKNAPHRSELYTIINNEYNNFWMKIQQNSDRKKPTTTANIAAARAAKRNKDNEMAKANVLIKLAYLCRPLGSKKIDDWKVVTSKLGRNNVKDYIELQINEVKGENEKIYTKFQFEENLELLIVALVGVEYKQKKQKGLEYGQYKDEQILDSEGLKIKIDNSEKKMTLLSKDEKLRDRVKKFAQDELKIYNTPDMNTINNNVYVFKYETKGKKNNPDKKSINFELSGTRKKMNSILPKDMKNKGKIMWPYAYEAVEFNPTHVYYGFDIISMSTWAVIGTVMGSIFGLMIIWSVIGPVIQKIKNRKSKR